MPKNSYIHFREIFDRFDIFLEKLNNHIDEILGEAQPTAKNLYQENNITSQQSFHLFKNKTLGQIKNIIQYAENTWQTKVIPELQADGRDENNNTSVRVRKNLFDQWKIQMTEKSEKFFLQFHETSTLELYQKAVEELKNLPDFICKHCSHKITITKIYTHATYITCELCNKKNIFTPTNIMRELFFHKKLIEKNSNILNGKYKIEF